MGNVPVASAQSTVDHSSHSSHTSMPVSHGAASGSYNHSNHEPPPPAPPATTTTTTPTAVAPLLDCTPCIDRRRTIVRVLVHGATSDPFWHSVAQAIRQTAHAMRVTLQFQLYDQIDSLDLMAQELEQLAQQVLQQRNQQQPRGGTTTSTTTNNDNNVHLRTGSSDSTSSSSHGADDLSAPPPSHHHHRHAGSPLPDVLVVTLPSEGVAAAVRRVVDAGLPVFGMNAGYHLASASGLLAFCGMDEFQAGIEAGREFQIAAVDRGIALRRVLFVNHHKGHIALEQRRQGLAEWFQTPSQQQHEPKEQPNKHNNHTSSSHHNSHTTVMQEHNIMDANHNGTGGYVVSTQAVHVDNAATAHNATMVHNATMAHNAAMAHEVDPHGTNSHNNNTNNFGQVMVEELVVGTDAAARTVEEQLRVALHGCPYQAVATSGGLVDVTLQVLREVCANTTHITQGHDFHHANHNNRPLLGCFDTDTRLYQAIAVQELDFAVSQQQWLQGALATAMASLYATTGLRLPYSRETQHGTYLSGPHAVNIHNLPTDSRQVCETEGFPVCSNDKNGDDNDDGVADNMASECLCFDSRRKRIAVVVHGEETAPFWLRVREAAQQAARDTNVQLEFDLNPPEPDGDVVLRRMAGKIVSYCLEGVDGLIVSIPSDILYPALEECRHLNIPITSVNAGAPNAAELGLLHHVAQDEYKAGLLAGRQLMNAGATRGLFLTYNTGFEFSQQRIQGFQDAFVQDLGPASFLGVVAAQADKDDRTIATTEQAVREIGGGWDNLGILVGGTRLVPPLLALADRNPGVIGGTFDQDPLISRFLETGDLVVAIDQTEYLQGYIPVLLLTWFVQTGQSLVNTMISSGPHLVLSAPGPAEEQCRENNFAVCPPPIDMELNQLGGVRILGYVFFATVFFTAVFFAYWVVRHRKTPIIQHAQPAFLFMVCVGAALMASTILVLAVDDEIASVQMCNIACMLGPWLFAIGFSITFAALFSKLMRLNILIKNAAHFRRVQVHMKDVMRPFMVLLGINVTLLLSWSLLDPMYWSRIAVTETESYGICRIGKTGISFGMAAVVGIVNLLALVVALSEAYKSRKVSYEYSESGSIAIVVASILQVAVVGGPILPLVSQDPTASFLLLSGFVLVCSMSTLLFIFVPKLRKSFARSPVEDSAPRSKRQSFAQSTIMRSASGVSTVSGIYPASASFTAPVKLNPNVLVKQLKYCVKKGEISREAILEAFDYKDNDDRSVSTEVTDPFLPSQEHAQPNLRNSGKGSNVEVLPHFSEGDENDGCNNKNIASPPEVVPDYVTTSLREKPPSTIEMRVNSDQHSRQLSVIGGDSAHGCPVDVMADSIRADANLSPSPSTVLTKRPSPPRGIISSSYGLDDLREDDDVDANNSDNKPSVVP